MGVAEEGRAQVVFVPGFMQQGEAWSPVARRVAEAHPTRCLDFRSWTFEERLGEIAAACTAPSVAVAYSMGGRLALHAAVRGPDRFAALVLVGASPGIEDEGERRTRQTLDESLADWIEGRSIEEVVTRWESMPVFASQSPALVAAQRPGRLTHDPTLLASLLRSAGQGALPALWERLGSIACPVLTVAGEADERYAAAARRMAELFPRGQSRLVAQAGHAPQLERPDEFASVLLQFLDEHLGDGGRGHLDPEPGPVRDG